MNGIKNIQTATLLNQIEITHLVYEKGDDGIMMACKIAKNSKEYYTNLSISFSQFNDLIAQLLQKGIDIYDMLSNSLFNENQLVSEVNLLSILGNNLIVNDFTLLNNAA